MANKSLRSIKFPGLSDTYIVPQIDYTLTLPGQPADAKVVGDRIGELREDLSQVSDGFWGYVYVTDFTNNVGKRWGSDATTLVDNSASTAVEFSCEYGDSFKLSGGFGSNSTFALYIVDESNNILKTVNNLPSGSKTDWELVINERSASKIRVTVVTHNFSAKKFGLIESIKSYVDQNYEIAGSGIYDTTQITLTQSQGVFTGLVGSIIALDTTATSWKYTRLECNAGDKFFVKTYMASNTAVTGYVYFTNDNFEILSIEIFPTGTQEWAEAMVTAPANSSYMYVKQYAYGSTLATVKSATLVSLTDKANTLASDLTALGKRLVAYEIYPTAIGLGFLGNTSQNDPLVVTTNGMFFYRNITNPSSDLTLAVSVDNQYSLSHGYALVFDVSTHTVSVVYNGGGYRNSNYYILLYKHGTLIKGAWAVYYYNDVLQKQFNQLKNNFFDTHYRTVRIMSRQGMFLKPGTQSTMPNNDRIGIKLASQKGYSEIRVTIWFTSDHVAVLSHDSTINSVARNSDGTEISETVTINDHTLAELNEYDYGIKYGSEYAGQTITTLNEALLLCKKYGLFTCIEVYPAFSVLPDDDIEALCDNLLSCGMIKSSEVRNPTLSNLEKVHNIISGANLSIAFYASDGDGGLTAKLNGIKALANHENHITMTTIPDTLSNQSFLSSIQKVQKEGIEIELASVYNLTDLKNAIENGIANVIETGYVEFPQLTLYQEFMN